MMYEGLTFETQCPTITNMAYIPMTVATLRHELADLPDDLPIIMSSDEEGNSFNKLYDVVLSKFDPSDDEPVHPDDLDVYNIEDLTDVVVLCP